MIVVVEGICAAGKTTWCSQHAAGITIPEIGRRDDAPDTSTDPSAAARFWAGLAAERWAATQSMEASKGAAVCDTDPLKLHYIWTLWRIGAARLRDWQHQYAATRDVVASGKLGFASLYLVKRTDPAHARLQRDRDQTRRRRNFDLHVGLQDPLVEWYHALEQALPGRVRWTLPDDGLTTLRGPVSTTSDRAIDIFDRIVRLLPQ